LDLGEKIREDNSNRGGGLKKHFLRLDRSTNLGLTTEAMEINRLGDTGDLIINRGKTSGKGNARESDRRSISEGTQSSSDDESDSSERGHFVKIVGCLVRRRVCLERGFEEER
jgi:hypothetical protein